jgi:lysophospholipase L1-like esterase
MFKKKINLVHILVLILSFRPGSIIAQVNPGFESGIDGWQRSGKTNLELNTNSFKGSNSIRLEDSSASVFQIIKIKPLSLIQLSAFVKSSGTEVQCCSFLGFYDRNDSLIIEYKSKPVSSVNYSNTGYYTLAPATSACLKYGIRMFTGDGIAWVDEIVLSVNPGESSSPEKPAVSIAQYMNPFWVSDTVFNETILLLSENGGKAGGRLLFNPSEILSIRSYDLKNSFSEGADYSIDGKSIIKTDGSLIPSVADTSFSSKDLAWYNLQSKWVVVSYTHKDRWNGNIPQFSGADMPETMKKLSNAAPLKIVACGMSITRGMDVSGYHNLPPYMPPYVDLFVYQLKKKFNYEDIILYNTGLPGAYVDWAAQYTDEYINSFNPDLVILDFGMNDFWKYKPEEFREYIKSIIEKCRSVNGKVEFLLISNMKFDPAYILPSNKDKAFYESNLEGYNSILKSFCSKGIINLDMTSLSDQIYRLKKPKDCLANPLHPNDYLARWYAQGMAALFIKQ